jgi:hypothetical protein
MEGSDGVRCPGKGTIGMLPVPPVLWNHHTRHLLSADREGEYPVTAYTHLRRPELGLCRAAGGVVRLLVVSRQLSCCMAGAG